MLLCRHLLHKVHISSFAARKFLDIPVQLALERLLHPISTPHAVGSAEELGARKPAECDLVQAYEALRAHDRTLVSNLPVSAYTRVAKEASRSTSEFALDDLVTDIVEVYQGDVHKRVQIIQSILKLTADQRHLRRDRVLSLLSNLKSCGSLSLLGKKLVIRVVMAVVENGPVDLTADKPLLDVLASLLLTALRAASVPPGTYSVIHQPPMVVRASFALTRRLLQAQQHEQALDMFQALVDSNNIPPEALFEPNSLPTNFTFIIQSTLVRSCLHWNWRQEAASLLMNLIKSAEAPRDEVFHLTVNAVYVLLEMPSGHDIVSSGTLIRALDKWNTHAIPHGLIRLFYESARHTDQGKEAEYLYSYTQSPSVLEREQYPPPQGRALTWLMHYLTLKSRNMHLARTLSKQVVAGFEPIPLQDRARFIALTAEHGYSTQARALWQRYSVGKDKDIVVGNAAMLVRVVSVFAKLIAQTQSKLQILQGKPSSGAETIEDLAFVTEQDRLEDMTRFVDSVVAEFRNSKEPLAQASHFDLNSLARAHFILGQFGAGFDVFRILMNRKEIPDLYDVNVAMSAMAEHDPRIAADMIERMIKKNLQPDPTTFGTVLHHAIVRGDVALVDDLVRRMSDLHRRLSLKSVQALIRASVQVEIESKLSVRLSMDRAFGVIRSLMGSGFVCQPNTGKYCIYACVRVDDPVMAYKFWKLLVKDKTDWGGREQILQRRLIASRIRKHCKAGWLSRERGTIMLSQLRGGFTK